MTKELRKTIAALLVAHDEVEEARRVAVSQVQPAESVGVTMVLAAEKCEAAEATTVRTAAKFIISLLTLLYRRLFCIGRIQWVRVCVNFVCVCVVCA